MNITKSSLIFSFFSFLGKVLGYVRDGSIAFFFGGSTSTDIFYVALKVMGSTSIVIGELTITPTFVSIYTKLKNNSLIIKEDFTKLVFITFFCFTIIFAVIVFSFPYVFISIFAPGYLQYENIDLIADVFRVMSLYPITIIMVSLLYAHLYVHERFALGPASPIIFNSVIVLGLLCLHLSNMLSIIYLAWSVVLAGFLQVLFLSLSFKFKIKLSINFGSIRKNYYLFLKTLWPAVLNIGFNQVDKLIGLAFASYTVGYVTYIYMAERIYTMPIELIGIPLATVLLTAVSNATIDESVRKKIFTNSIKYLIYLIIPASFGLYFLSEDLLSIFFERGKFTKQDVAMTNDLLKGFLIGLPAFTLVTTLNPYFFSINKTNILFYCAIIASIINILLLVIFYPKYGPISIAYSLSFSKYINLFLLLYHLKKLKINFLNQEQFINILKSLIFSISMIYIMFLFMNNIFLTKLIYVNTSLLITIGLVTYILLTIIFNNKFSKEMYQFILNRNK